VGESKDVELKTYDGFKSAKVSAKDIQERLSHARRKAISTGIQVVDDVFGGILPNDIVLLGAKTGVGKTALASKVALHNTMLGKKIYMYALEAEPEEIQMRILYERLVSKARAFNPRKKYNFKHWRLGRYEELNTYYDECLSELNNFENLYIYYRKQEFGIDEFIKLTMSVKNDADLIIIDHIHYFDGVNENEALSEAIKKIRDISLLTGVPVVILAHLRKSQGNEFKLVPNLDDFHGSSDLSKVCTKGVILAPGNQKGDSTQTLFSFPKFRGFSTPSKFLFRCDYDIYLNQYAPTYTVHRFRYNTVKLNLDENLVDPEELSWLG
jgi:replicative DNA helicase